MRKVGCRQLLDIEEVAIRMVKAADHAEDIVTTLVAAKNAKETMFNFAPSPEGKS